MPEVSARRRMILILALLAIAAVAPYWQTRSHEFIHYDDKPYVWDNPIVLGGVTVDGIKWAFTALFASNWHPITWLSHMVDCSLFVQGDGRQWAGGHHLVNVLIHLLNTQLVFGVLQALTKAPWRSALVAGLFAVHPLHVESVAWIAERKDVLSTMFGLLAIMGYVGYVQRPSLARYLLIVVLFGLSLMSKPMLVTLPCVLLLLDYWPLGRLQRASVFKLLTEKLPLLAMSIGSSVITVIAQKTGGSVYPLEAYPMGQRLANVAVAYVQYIAKMFWPVELAVMYPLPDSWPAPMVFLSALVLIVISVLVWVLRRKRPHLLMGWLWFLGTLVPVIGLFQVGLQSMADRYTYVPMIGLFIMIAWAIPAPVSDQRTGTRAAVSTIAAAVLALLAHRAWVQTSYWHDTMKLFDRTLALTEKNHIALTMRGYVLEEQGNYEQAIAEYRKVLKFQKNFRATWFNLANCLVQLGRPEESIPYYKTAIELMPKIALSHHNLGVAYLRLNRLDDAAGSFREALRLNPMYADPHFNLGLTLTRQMKIDEAIGEFRQAVELSPRSYDAHAQLGIALAMQDRIDEAIASFEEALRLRPDSEDAKKYLQLARQQKAQRAGG